MTYFFDRCVAITVAGIIKALERADEVIYRDDKFNKRTPDTEWLRTIASWDEKPIVISGDTRILTRPDEAAELAKGNLMFFCLAPGWTNIPFEDYPWKFLKAWANIKLAIRENRRPTIFKVFCGKSFKVERLRLTQDHR